MIPGFSKPSITIGSDPSADIRLGGPGVAPQHATIVHQGGGTLMFIDNRTGQSLVNGQPIAPGSSVPFDFRAQFVVGQMPVPNVHPALALMLMSQGSAPVVPGQLTLGRDAQKVQLVVNHPNVSGRHATFQLQPLSVVDLGSTAGTWLNRQRLPAEQAVPVDPHALVAVGAVPVPMQLVLQLAQLLGGAAVGAPAAAARAPKAGTAHAPAASAGDDQEPKKKHKTVIGQIQLAGSGEQRQTIGRTPENDIPIAHPQVSSRHAFLIKVGSQLFLEDRGSANGTYVRGQRIPPNQRIQVQSGEKVFIGPMPLLLQVRAEELKIVIEDQQANWAGRPLYEIEAWDLVIQVPDRDNP